MLALTSYPAVKIANQPHAGTKKNTNGLPPATLYQWDTGGTSTGGWGGGRHWRSELGGDRRGQDEYGRGHRSGSRSPPPRRHQGDSQRPDLRHLPRRRVGRMRTGGVVARALQVRRRAGLRATPRAPNTANPNRWHADHRKPVSCLRTTPGGLGPTFAAGAPATTRSSAASAQPPGGGGGGGCSRTPCSAGFLRPRSRIHLGLAFFFSPSSFL